MNERPNVTVVYQDASPRTPSAGAVLGEVIVFLLLAGGVAVLAGGGCMWLWK